MINEIESQSDRYLRVMEWILEVGQVVPEKQQKWRYMTNKIWCHKLVAVIYFAQHLALLE